VSPVSDSPHIHAPSCVHVRYIPPPRTRARTGTTTPAMPIASHFLIAVALLQISARAQVRHCRRFHSLLLRVAIIAMLSENSSEARKAIAFSPQAGLAAFMRSSVPLGVAPLSDEALAFFFTVDLLSCRILSSLGDVRRRTLHVSETL